MNNQQSEENLFPEKGKPDLKIYAWSTTDVPKYAGCLKIGHTTREINKRIKESQGQTRLSYKVEILESAYREDGTSFRDKDVRDRLEDKGFENVELEWMRCTPKDALDAIKEIRFYEAPRFERLNNFQMRQEQAVAVEQTAAYYESVWAANKEEVPHFLWNAKMRFGKTFASYQLAKRIGARRVLVMTYIPAAGDAWETDLNSHTDFEEWRYLSSKDNKLLESQKIEEPFVYFGSLQDLMGKKDGAIKPKNEWIHLIDWDLVILDEYHFGAWRENARELFENPEGDEDKKITEKEYNNAFPKILDTYSEEFEKEGHKEKDFLPVPTKAFLYLSGTPFRALATGQFLEEQIFNWTYTDEQAAKQKFNEDHPNLPNPYSALPKMQLLTYQMPDELIAIANQGEFNEFDLNAFFKAKGSGRNATFVNKDYVQKWLDIIRGSYLPTQLSNMKEGTRPPFPYSDTRLLPFLQHSFWFLPNVSSCEAMSNLLQERNNIFWHDYEVLVVAGDQAGMGADALPPVRNHVNFPIS